MNPDEPTLQCAWQLGVPAQATILDARFAPLQVLRSLLPDLIIAVDVEVVGAVTGLSTSAIWAKCDANSPTFDPEFPKPVKHRGLRRTVWNLNAVQRYLELLFQQAEANADALGEQERNAPMSTAPLSEGRRPSDERSARRSRRSGGA